MGTVDEIVGTVDGILGTVDGILGTVDGILGTVDEVQNRRTPRSGYGGLLVELGTTARCARYS